LINFNSPQKKKKPDSPLSSSLAGTDLCQRKDCCAHSFGSR